MYEVRARIAGVERSSDETMPVLDKFSEEIVAQLHITAQADTDAALDAARAAVSRNVTPYERANILRGAAERIGSRRGELCTQMRTETGFSLADANKEVDRAIDTLGLSANEAMRFGGAAVPFSSAPGVTRRLGFTIRKPVGVVAAITPFNSPLNTVCHKVGPAIAAGNAVVLKPASQTPSSAVTLADCLYESGLPTGLLHVVHGPGGRVGAYLAADPRVDFIAFTGSTSVGLALHHAAGLRRTQLELGSISCTVIDKDAEISKRTLDNCVNAAFRKAGQVCTSIQRLYVHHDVEHEVLDLLLSSTKDLVVGDPKDDATQIGPLISRSSAERLEQWIDQATGLGARVLIGGTRTGTILDPTVLTDLGPGMRLHDEEAFGPVLGLYSYQSDDEVIDHINATPYGLAAGVFTRDLHRALEIANRLRVGSLYVNGTSSNRVDLMPYGGLKESGHGREGPAYAVEEMSEETLVSIEWSDPNAL